MSAAIPQDTDDLYRLLVDRVTDYAIFRLDPHGIVMSWNKGAQAIKGYQAHEIIGHHFSRFYPEDAVRAGWPQTELEHARRVGRFEDEGWRIRKDGSRFWANVIITALHDDDGRLRGFAKVTRDLTERKRMERLEADAHQMGEFVAMLAHELRNPLAPIRSAINLALHARHDPAKLDWALGVLDRQSTHLTKLVEDLLDVSRVTRGRITLERRRVRLSQALADALDIARPHAEAKAHEVEVVRVADPLVRGDRTRLTQVIANLLNNACKYTPENGRIRVVLDVDGECARVTVADDGIGIPDDLLPRVFDLFTQDQRALDRSEGGLGLGLAIAKRLAEMHRGSLTAASAGRGCGSTFALRLPLFTGGEPGSDNDRLNVLIVEDNRDAAETLRALLELAGHQVSLAADGEAGYEAALRLQPDIAFLDIGLPRLNGYQLARRLRGVPELEGITLAAITGYGGEDDRREAIDSGFDLHFSKPVSYEELVERIPALASRER
jgi:PAS domain S-box-containing protein